MSIIDDWLRQHPSLKLTRDQYDTLEELIDEAEDDGEGSAWYRDEIRLEERQEGWTAGAKAMRENIAALFVSAATNGGDVLGLRNAFDHITTAIEKLPTPEYDDAD